MEQEAQLDIFSQLLRRLHGEGVLSQIMLIGSWCLVLYKSALPKADILPTVRTLDVDFLIPDQRAIHQEVNLPELLKEMGFVPAPPLSSGWIVYDHPELRVEFLAPERGRGSDEAQKIGKLHVTAQGLRYLNLLADHPRKLSYSGFSVCVPEPAAYALQKLIVSARRTEEAKRQRDLEAAVAVSRKYPLFLPEY